jgi:hypothetical protein
MTAFPDCFVLIFGQLAVGGLLCLSIPPFHSIERGFFKSSAGVFVGAAVALVAAKTALLLRSPGPRTLWPELDLGVWMLFTAAAGLYLYSLWGNPYRLRARAYLVTLTTGIVALATSAAPFRVAPLLSLETVIYPLSFLTSAGVLGAAATGMLLGHWYLIDPGMSLVPLQRVLRTFIVALSVQVGVLVLALAVLSQFAAPTSGPLIARLWTDHLQLLIARVALGPLPAFALAAMIRRTLAIPQTMAATGLFYIAILAVLVGEMLGRFVLFRTSLPL